MQYQPKNHKWIFLSVALLAALSIATPVLADYLGPNRTVTTTVSVCQVVLYECKLVDGKYKDKRVEDWSCSNESKPWEAYPGSGSCHVGDVGRKHWERDERTETITTTYDPATIAGSIQNCTLQNGWCVNSAPELALNANEPLSGYSILLIEGTLNGMSFACPNGATSCSIPLGEGNNNFTYWALSSWGDSSTMGNSAAQVDTVAPDVSADLSGTPGVNPWYVSPITVTATGTDATSGVASALLTTDNVTWQPSITLNEGVHPLAFEVRDNAGNVSNASTTISVDTTTPVINLSVTGTAGNNGWYKSVVQVSAVASDATSGVGTFEVSADGAAYQAYTMPVSFGDGHHTIRFKAVDKAGNQTETLLQDFYVDTLAPAVDLPRSWRVEKNVIYTAQENGSGLAALRVVIEDEDERYAKVTWDEPVSGATFSDNIHWNGIFKDKTAAPPGTYLVWIKVSDMAGNERFQLGKVIVPEPNVFLSPLPTEEPSALPPTPPAELFEPEAASAPTAVPALGFGGETTEAVGTTTHSLILSSSGSAGATSANTSSGILWGAAAAAAIGAATAYALETSRKRKEAEAEQAAQLARAMADDAKERAKKQQKQQQNWAEQQASQQAQHAYPVHIDLKVARMEAAEGAAAALKRLKQAFNRTLHQDARMARKEALVEQEMRTLTAKPSDWKAAYDKYMQQKAITDWRQKEWADPEKSWWQKTWDGVRNTADKALKWVDQHQTELAIGIGLIAGTAAIILTAGLATPLVLAAASGAMLAAGGIVAAGTMGLNAYYGRPLAQNLLKNMSIAAGTVLATTLVGLLLTKGVFVVGNGAARYCVLHPAVCARAGFVMGALDTLEEVGLFVKGAFQGWRGDDIGAAETALELQMEHMDGGMPGNSVAKEVGGEALEKVAKYGDEAVNLVELYGIDAVEIIVTYGDDGIALLQKYGDDALRLINAYGERAIKLMSVVDPNRAQKLLRTLDDDVIDDVMQQGPEAVEALSGWGEKALSGHGVELALRASKDAEVLADVKKLVSLRPIDPKHLTQEQETLIKAISEKSTYYSDEGQVVLGRWIDLDSGFREYAQDTKSMYYGPHPDVWNLMDGLDNQADVAWLVNRQVVQTGIAKGLPFEYTLNDIPIDGIAKEQAAIRAIFSGKTDAEIINILEAKYMPIRMKELQELQKAGYEFVFDDVTNSYILIRP